uniref:Zinc phosphodiesterase ELAC protein 2 n=1 Tax=Cuerna arida TaxID=1464854 RepID=A0A1B6FUU4_9HEMI
MIYMFNIYSVVNYIKRGRCKFFKALRHFSSSDTDHLFNIISKMPKNTTHTVALKKHRQKLKEKGQKYAPGTVTLQVLGSGASGAPRSLYVFTDQSRYLFNCGEGTQRLAHEHKMKLSKLEHIFLTHPSWENIGGLPGVSLTIQDVGVPQITIHGPQGTDEIFVATRKFVVLRHLVIKMASCDKNTIFEDNVMKVQYVPLYTPAAKRWLATPASERSPPRTPELGLGSEDSTDDDVDYYSYWQTGSRPSSPDRDGSPGRSKKRRHLSPESRSGKDDRPPPGSISMAYVCRLNDRPGTLNLQACVSHGVPPGPLLGKLKAGEDVTLADGTVVLSKDVTSPDEPGPVFIVVECPTEEFLDSLEEEEMFKRHQASATDPNITAYLVVHFTPPHIMANPRYQGWMSKFSPSTHHLVLNSSNHCMGSVAVHRIQHKLHLLDQQIFPLLGDQGIPLVARNCSSEAMEVNGLDNIQKFFSIIKGNTFTNISLRPQRFFDSSSKLVLEPEVYRQETLAVEGFPEALRSLKEQLTSIEDDQRDFPQVVFLGTGSCIPNKTRNTSGILIHLSDTISMIVDCGEATYGQLVRLYGQTRSDEVIRNVRAIYVSHLHADHHIGLVGLLKARLRLGGLAPLYLLAPRQIRTWLHTYHRHFEPILPSLQLIPNGELLYNDCTLEDATMSQLLESVGLTQVQTCYVKHCPNAFGIALTHADGWKITYSGDTMPSDNLIKLGKDSDLLIHEATMEDDLEGEAKLKMHSTTSQAVQVGRQMAARFTLLTHFSQRYAKVPIFSDSFTANVGIAFDNMQVRLSDLPKLPLMYSALKLMFAEHYEEMELKAIKRQLQQERELTRVST